MSLGIERPTFFDLDDPFARTPAAAPARPLFGEGGPSFDDLLDVLNPLQHLPVIGTIYRALTGDALSDGARLAGGALYGGPIGLVAAMANLGVAQATGRDLGETALAALVGEDAPEAAASPQLAAAEPAPESPDPTRLAASAPVAEPAAPSPARDLPQLSPEAFDALMRSVNAPAAQERPAAAAASKARNPAWSRAGVASAPVAPSPAMRAALPRAGSAALDALGQMPGLPPVAAPGARQAGLELHETLRAYALQNGVAPVR